MGKSGGFCGGDGHPQAGIGHPGQYGGQLRPAQGALGGEGAGAVHAGEDARPVEGQHLRVAGVGQDVHRVDGGEGRLGQGGAQPFGQILAGGGLLKGGLHRLAVHHAVLPGVPQGVPVPQP